MTKLITITADGWHWLGFRLEDGRTQRLHRMAPVGHCISPGQRWKGV